MLQKSSINFALNYLLFPSHHPINAESRATAWHLPACIPGDDQFSFGTCDPHIEQAQTLLHIIRARCLRRGAFVVPVIFTGGSGGVTSETVLLLYAQRNLRDVIGDDELWPAGTYRIP